ncbi:MAG: endonuclease, partial [Magnetococcales bacterium]|nr:endonuclease [Magnetococcales bacterium]
LLITQNLIASLGDPEVDPTRARNGGRHTWSGSFLWSDVPAFELINFLINYTTHPGAYKVNTLMLAEFIQSMSLTGELTHWTVAVIGGGEGSPLALRDEVVINMTKRKMKGTMDDKYSISRLRSPRDEAIDLDENAWNAALQMTKIAWQADPGRQQETGEPDIPNGSAIRKIRGFGAPGVDAHPERGLFLLYCLDPKEAEVDFPEDTPPIAAFSISFPGSNSGTKVEYKVNNILWEQEYGATE